MSVARQRTKEHSLSRPAIAPLPKRCIFCDAKAKLSKEDFFPQWFREIYPASQEAQKARLNAEISWHEPDPETGGVLVRIAKSRLARPGDLADQTLKVVCEPCNNGWMSRLQQAAKPHLLPYIMGKWPRPNRLARKVISSWATMFSMVIEFADGPSRIVPLVERNTFSKDLRPPIGSFIWAGRLAGDVPYWFHRRALRLASSVRDQGPANTSLTTITLGHLLLQVYLTTTDREIMDPKQRAMDEHLSPLWPLNLKAPRHHTLLIRDEDAVRDFAYRHISDRVYFGFTEDGTHLDPFLDRI